MVRATPGRRTNQSHCKETVTDLGILFHLTWHDVDGAPANTTSLPVSSQSLVDSKSRHRPASIPVQDHAFVSTLPFNFPTLPEAQLPHSMGKA
jgi:hypothetical protein